MIETKRTYLRYWSENDATTLYHIAKEKEVAYPCGWLPHSDIEHSKKIIATVLNNNTTFAICLKENNTIIGNISIMRFPHSNFASNMYEGEIGYWISKEYWGQGYASECVNAILSYGFHTLKLNTIWAGHFLENVASKKVQLKCGLTYSHTLKEVYIHALKQKKDLCALKISRSDFIKQHFSLRKATIEDDIIIATLEKECFPIKEAATLESIQDRLKYYHNHFYLLFYDDTLISFINGMCTSKKDLEDEMYTKADLHQEEGDWQMIFSICTKEEFRNNSYASFLMYTMIKQAKTENRKGIVLTCKKALIPFYASFGFKNESLSKSKHGNVEWYQMRITF